MHKWGQDGKKLRAFERWHQCGKPSPVSHRALLDQFQQDIWFAFQLVDSTRSFSQHGMPEALEIPSVQASCSLNGLGPDEIPATVRIIIGLDVVHRNWLAEHISNKRKEVHANTQSRNRRTGR